MEGSWECTCVFTVWVSLCLLRWLLTKHQKCRNREHLCCLYQISNACCPLWAQAGVWEVKETSDQSTDFMDKCSALFWKSKTSEHNKELFPNLNLPPEQQLSTLADEQMSSRKAVSMASTPSSVGTGGPSARGAKREQRGKKSFCHVCLGCATLGLVCSMRKRSEREN